MNSQYAYPVQGKLNNFTSIFIIIIIPSSSSFLGVVINVA